MASDDKDAGAQGTRSGDAKPEVTTPADAKAERAPPEHAEGERLGGERADDPSEWTASDSRGPLSSADGEADVPTSADAPTPPEAPRYRPVAPPGTTSAAHESASTLSGARASEVAPSSVAPARRSPWPIAAGIVVGALIGAGSAVLYSSTQGDTSAKAQIDALGARIAALEKKPDAEATVDPLKASVADLGAKIAALPKAQAFDPAPMQDKLGALETSVAALQKQSAGDKGLATAVETLKQQGADLKQQADSLKGLDDKVGGLAAAVAGLQKQDETAKATIDTLQSSQKSLEGKAAAPSLAVAADSLVQQIERGEPYAAQVDALAGLGADPAKVAVLRENAGTGVPSAKVLAAKFAPLADPITALAYRPKPNAGMMDRLKSGIFSMVSVRRVDDTTGDDLGSRVSRIEADLAHDDVADAYATWSALPADAKAKSDAWGALAKTHADAMAAARALQQQAIAALAAKKS